jgi:uncharacterized membrane protein
VKTLDTRVLSMVVCTTIAFTSITGGFVVGGEDVALFSALAVVSLTALLGLFVTTLSLVWSN